MERHPPVERDERYACGPFILDVSGFRLLYRDQPVSIQAKPFELLVALARARGGLVTNEDLSQTLWPDVVVTEQSLRQALMKLRKVLGEHAALVETVPRRGLRWAGSLEPLVSGDGLELIDRIGTGATAEVWKVRHVRHGLCALKRLKAHDPSLRARLHREAHLQAQVVHPNVLPVLDVLIHDGCPSLLLPLVQGPTLERLLARRKLSVDEAAAIFRAIVCGVAAIHEAGLVHRDLKPQNVLLDLSDGLVPRVADFGLARSLDDPHRLTQAGDVLGTLGYAAPEQRADAMDTQPSADVYSLGRVLLDLFGERAAPWDDLVRQLTERDPTLRPPDARAILALLPETGPVPETLLSAVQQLSVSGGPEARIASMPPERDTFVGREAEMGTIDQHLQQGHRLISLVGVGGSGKTRLAVRFARSRRDEFVGGTWFCDLSEARDLDSVCVAVSQTLGLSPVRTEAPETLGSEIASLGRCLLVLDNIEQVVGPATTALRSWIHRASEARFIATSRQVLGMPEEMVLSLPPLAQEPSVELFVRRAQAAGWGPSSPQQSTDTIEQLIYMLDGLPLAIELAAARSVVLTPEQMLARMRDRFRWLRSTSGETPPRHQTLRASLDGSWEMLDEEERSALAQLSVFEGSFSLEAAEGVLSLPQTWPMDAVQSLVCKSLVRRNPDARFSLLASVRDYAREHLSASEHQAASLRHGDFFARMGAAFVLSQEQGGLGVAAEAREAIPELYNLLAAAERALERGDGGCCADAALAANLIQQRIGGRQSMALLTALLASPAMSAIQSRTQIHVRLRVAARAIGAGRYEEALAQCQSAWALACDAADRWAVACWMGLVYDEINQRDTARSWFDTALDSARSAEDLRGESYVLSSLGVSLRTSGQLVEAHACFERAATLACQHGLVAYEASDRTNLGIVLHDLDRPQDAVRSCERAVVLYRSIGDEHGEAKATSCLGSVHAGQGRSAAARACFEAALGFFSRSGRRTQEGYTLANLARLHDDLGHADEALSLYERAVERLRGQPFGCGPALADMGLLQAKLGQYDACESSFEQAETMLRAGSAPAALAKVLVRRSRAALERGETGEAKRWLSEAETLARDRGLGKLIAEIEALREQQTTLR